MMQYEIQTNVLFSAMSPTDSIDGKINNNIKQIVFVWPRCSTVTAHQGAHTLGITALRDVSVFCCIVCRQMPIKNILAMDTFANI